MDQSVEEKRKKLEWDILTIIAERLKDGKMELPKAQEIAKMLLDKLHPPLTLEQLYEIAPTLDDHYAELTKAVLPLMQEHDEVIRKVVSEHAEKLIKSGKLDEAHALLKKTTKKGEKQHA